MTFMRKWNVLFSFLLAAGLHAQTANLPESSLTPYYGVDSGAANVMVVTVQGCPSSYVTGTHILVKPNNANSTTTPTLNVCGLGAKTIVKFNAAPLVANDIIPGANAFLDYDGTNFQLLNPQTIVGTTDTQTLTNKSIAASEVNSGSYQILPSLMTKQVTNADMTCGTGGTNSSCTAATTITGLTFTLPAVAASYSFECFLIVGQATAATANQWLVQTATNGATNMMLTADIRTASATSALLVTTGQASTTTAVEIGGATWTLAATGTKMLHRLYGTIEGASSSGSTLNFQVIAPTVADLLTIYRGSTCRIF